MIRREWKFLRRFSGKVKNINLIVTLLITIAMFASMFPSYAAEDPDAPDAKFSISNVTPSINQSVTFDASESTSKSGSIVSYEWDFKDGSKGNGAVVTHAFNQTDDYNVELKVTDSSGRVNTKKKRVFIGRPEGWTEKSHHKSADADYDLLFPEDKVNRIDIKMTSSDYQVVKNEVASFNMNSTKELTYVPATIQYNGKTWWNVGFRCKGNSSLSNSKNTYKIPFRLNFDKFEDKYPQINDQHFYGFSELTFGNCWGDSSFMKEKVAADIFREGGVPSARTSFCRVYVDTGSGPKYWGLYNMTEDPADAMLEEQFGDDSGNCYKPDGAGASWKAPFDQKAFEKKTNEEEADWSDVKNAHTALHASKNNPEQWRANLDKYFNSTGFLRWLAINTAIVNWDAYGQMTHNYYLYNDIAKDGRLVWITWDHNLAFGSGMGGFGGGGGGFGGFPGGGGFGGFGGTKTLSLDEVTADWPLIRKLLDDSVYKNVYHYEMKQALNGCMNVQKIEAKVRAYQTMIKPYIIGSQGETSDSTMLSGGESAFNKACDDIITHMKTRQTEVSNYINKINITATPTPVSTPTPSNTPTPQNTIAPVTVGDINNDGDINSTDMSLLKRYVLGVMKEFGNSSGYIAADIDKSGTIDSTDCALLKRKVLGLVK